MEKSFVLNQLRKHIQEELNASQGTKNGKSKLYSKLENVSEADIVFGECPSYFYASMICNSTGVGESTFEGTKTQRTVALDYETDVYLFVDGHLGTAQKGLEIFFLKPGETVMYYKKSEIEKVAKDYGDVLHRQQFNDLNFFFCRHRLNRYNVNIVKGPFSYPIRPIFAALVEETEPILIGYTYEMDGEEYVLIDFVDPGKAKKKSGCAPWMFLGIIFPPILIVAIGVFIYRVLKE